MCDLLPLTARFPAASVKSPGVCYLFFLAFLVAPGGLGVLVARAFLVFLVLAFLALLASKKSALDLVVPPAPPALLALPW